MPYANMLEAGISDSEAALIRAFNDQRDLFQVAYRDLVQAHAHQTNLVKELLESWDTPNGGHKFLAVLDELEQDVIWTLAEEGTNGAAKI